MQVVNKEKIYPSANNTQNKPTKPTKASQERKVKKFVRCNKNAFKFRTTTCLDVNYNYNFKRWFSKRSIIIY